MDHDSKRLGSELQASREQRRPKLTQPGAAEKLKVSRNAIQNIEHGKITRVTPTVRAYAALLGWPGGAVDHVWEGGTLADYVADEPEPAPAPSAPDGLGLSPTVEYELRSGKTLESTVINLGPDEDDGHIIVVLQGKKDATPEEVAKVAERYRKARRHLQSIAAEADGGVDG
ncbi:helix-turn-helix domain-containing protein [Streptomyces sp. NPDC059063]|uniref:helix-turn-helix domain-containing protein n=1 Tax=unclassified Streptomyces TaxID=2593676 RepID=UPI0036978DA4